MIVDVDDRGKVSVSDATRSKWLGRCNRYERESGGNSKLHTVRSWAVRWIA